MRTVTEKGDKGESRSIDVINVKAPGDIRVGQEISEANILSLLTIGDVVSAFLNEHMAVCPLATLARPDLARSGHVWPGQARPGQARPGGLGPGLAWLAKPG